MPSDATPAKTYTSPYLVGSRMQSFGKLSSVLNADQGNFKLLSIMNPYNQQETLQDTKEIKPQTGWVYYMIYAGLDQCWTIIGFFFF